jgi:L-lactate utilization protein LutB
MRYAMDEFVKEKNELLAQTVIKGLTSRNMKGFYAKDKDEARRIALSMIPEGSTISQGGCMSSLEIGLIDALNEGNYHFIDRSKMDSREALLAAYDSDIFLSSCNAMTSDGILVNIDGNANRVSCIANGPKKVIFIVGMNKICADLDSAIKRARNVAAPSNAMRFPINTPCKKTGKCFDCKQPDTICCQFLITRYSHHKDRINVILVNNSLGF